MWNNRQWWKIDNDKWQTMSKDRQWGITDKGKLTDGEGQTIVTDG